MSDVFFQASVVTSKQLENAIISKANDVERIINVFKKQEMTAAGNDGNMPDEQRRNNLKYLDEVSSDVNALQAIANNTADHAPGFSSRSSSASSSIADEEHG